MIFPWHVVLATPYPISADDAEEIPLVDFLSNSLNGRDIARMFYPLSGPFFFTRCRVGIGWIFGGVVPVQCAGPATADLIPIPESTIFLVRPHCFFDGFFNVGT